MDSDRQSILSHGEREIAAMLREGRSVEEIASTRDEPPAVVEKAIDRIRAKTDRAIATLVESPFARESLHQYDAETRAKLQSRLLEE